MGMIPVVFNIEAGNYYELVFILVILYILEYLCGFTKLFTGTRVSKDFQFQVSGSRNNKKRTTLGVVTCTCMCIHVDIYYLREIY